MCLIKPLSYHCVFKCVETSHETDFKLWSGVLKFFFAEHFFFHLGTAYVEENLRPPQYRHLKYDPERNRTYLAVDHTYVHVDNEGRDVPPPTVIMEENKRFYEFDEAELTGHARLIFYHPDSEAHKAVKWL